jgi:serine/threonine-protein kinase PknG
MEQSCAKTGCSGKIVDGYCDTCGKAASPSPARATTASAVASSAASRGSLSSRSTSSSSSRRSSRGSRVNSDRLLGAGFVSLPELPPQDPLLLVIDNPVVPERKRFCGNCDAKLTREKGFCPNCGNEYSFIPTLNVGDILEDQFEIKGPIAFGGLGWIYLAWDKVLSRWTVLKGLLNSKDPAAAAAALAERQFLAAVKHPKIVTIYNFITRGTGGFIVMEYVGGKTLKALRQERGPLPPAEAIAYIHAILPAFAYLHRLGYIYCDFKPDNCMLEGDDVKLIDLGGVRRIEDTGGDIYGTKGYSAPEASAEPSISADLYTVARTLAVLMFDFGFQGAYLKTLPPPTEQPLLAEFDSLRRWFNKATANDPDQRFQYAEEMADQLLGVLRDVVCKSGKTKHVESKYFQAEHLSSEIEADYPTQYKLPALKMDPNDPATTALVGLVGLPDATLVENLKLLSRKIGDSAEYYFFVAAVHLEAGRLPDTAQALKRASELSPDDWRLQWFLGKIALVEGKPGEAVKSFDAVMDELPGEVAPRLAKAVSLEIAGLDDEAISLFENVVEVEPSLVGAFFGLSRCMMRKGHRSGAVTTLARIPASSSMAVYAKMKTARLLMETASGMPNEADLLLAGQTLSGLTVEGYEVNKVSADLFLVALEVVLKSRKPNPSTQILGHAFDERNLRLGAEQQLRKTAKYAKSNEERTSLIDRANAVRPWTLF